MKRRDGKTVFGALILMVSVGFVCSGIAHAVRADETSRRESSCSLDAQIEEVSVVIPGVEEPHTLLWVSDMHIVSGAQDRDVTKENQEKVQERYEMMKDASGRSSAETWELLSAQIDSYDPDYVIFGADMIDYMSEENLEKLKAGLEQISTPWMYLRADHDYGRWYSDMGKRRMRKLHREIAPQNKLWVERFGEFTVAGLDNTTTAISRETLDAFRDLCEEGTPIILCTHVPFDSGTKDTQSLRQLSKDLWEDRVLCWGEQDKYDTSSGGCMKELMELITAPDSPVCAVLAGHLHASWEGQLTDTCMEHVFSAAFQDNIGMITVSGHLG